MFNCTLCNYSNQHKKNFIQHCESKIHISKEELKLFCCMCNKSYISNRRVEKDKIQDNFNLS
jgi:hypothetical protein